MNQTIQILVVILLSCSIITVIRLWSVLGSARTTLENLETTRREADNTLQRLSEVAISTDRVMREEVAPTLQQTRATLENVEATTRALAQTSQAIGRLTGHAETLSNAQRLLSLGGNMMQGFRGGSRNNGNGKKGENGEMSKMEGKEIRSKSAFGNARITGFGMAFAAVSRLRSLFAKRKPLETDVPQIETQKALPSADNSRSVR